MKEHLPEKGHSYKTIYVITCKREIMSNVHKNKEHGCCT